MAAIKLAPGNMKERINSVKSVWKNIHPSSSFEYEFLDEKIDNLYRQEQRMMVLFQFFGLLAIVIACLGLFGLVSFLSQQRTKEVGVRKVNGANTFTVVLLLIKDFTKWVAIAFIIACPIAYFAMNKWLQNFAYRTNLSWLVFVLAGAIAYVVALLTVSFQSWRAATRNPVEALRYE